MPDLIRLLPDAIANQIAAGEVVQRPASVVKELLENAVDAGAKSIRVIVHEAGRQLIQVIDDGKGMSPADTRLSIERHATSKISSAEDLFALRTMGFRGEALASIAAVAQLEIRTRRPSDETGTLLQVDGSVVRREEPDACPAGTGISVRNLFFNIPARRNFLKGNPVEMKHIVEEFTRFALAWPGLALMLVNGDEVVFDLQPAKLSQRIVSLFGRSYQQQLAECQEEVGSLKISGYIGRPELARRTRSEQFLFVNNRYVRNPGMHHAIMSAFEGLLADGAYPFYVLFLEVDPRHVDVNVHPAKTEIKFTDDKSVYNIVRVAVRRALGVHQLVPPLDFSSSVNLGEKFNLDPQGFFTRMSEEQSGRHQSNLDNWQSLMPAESLRPSPQLFSEESPVSSGARVVFQFQNRFIIREVSNGLMIIDQQAAHERVLFDRYQNLFGAGNGASQQLLFPLALDFSPSDFMILESMVDDLTRLGFRMEPLGKQNMSLSGIPPEAASREKEVLEVLIEQFRQNGNSPELSVQENISRSLARGAAVRSGQPLTREEVDSLVRGLFSSHSPSITPDGRPTFFIFDAGQMAGFFNR